MSNVEHSFTISPEIPDDQIDSFYEFIDKEVLRTFKDRFCNIVKTSVNSKLELAYSIVDEKGKAKLRVQLTGGKPLNVFVTPLQDTVTQDEIQTAREDIVLAVSAFEEQVRKNSLFFAWREGDTVVPEKVKSNNRSSRFLLETQILLMIVFTGMSMVLFYFLGVYFAVAVLAIQFVFVYYSSKIIAKTSDWHITKKKSVYTHTGIRIVT